MSFRKQIIMSAGLALLAASAHAAPSQQGSASKNPKERRYCIQYESETGTRLRREECRTKQEWERLGVNVDEKSNK